MTRTIWLASYPKSGSTWMRVLIGNVRTKDDRSVGLDAIACDRSAMGRRHFDLVTLVDSGLLTHDEIDRLRPRAYEAIARGLLVAQVAMLETDSPVRFLKVHDAYTMTPAGEPLLGGSECAQGAILIVRDPRDVAPSLAHHVHKSIDDTITSLNDDSKAWCERTSRMEPQLRQKLSDWSSHTATWLDQRDIPVHVVRYEDLLLDTVSALSRAMAFAGVPTTGDDIKRAVSASEFAKLQLQEEQNGFKEATRLNRRFFRRGKAGSWRSELNPEQVARIEARHGRMMQRLGYELSYAAALARAG